MNVSFTYDLTTMLLLWGLSEMAQLMKWLLYKREVLSLGPQNPC